MSLHGWPGGTKTVSFQPLRCGGGRPSTSSTWNCTSCTWKLCGSPSLLETSQISVRAHGDGRVDPAHVHLVAVDGVPGRAELRVTLAVRRVEAVASAELRRHRRRRASQARPPAARRTSKRSSPPMKRVSMPPPQLRRIAAQHRPLAGSHRRPRSRPVRRAPAGCRSSSTAGAAEQAAVGADQLRTARSSAKPKS